MLRRIRKIEKLAVACNTIVRSVLDPDRRKNQVKITDNASVSIRNSIHSLVLEILPSARYKGTCQIHQCYRQLCSPRPVRFSVATVAREGHAIPLPRPEV